MNVIYIVTEGWSYEGEQLVGAYSTIELARTAAYARASGCDVRKIFATEIDGECVLVENLG